jgi:hypothetical protein
MVFWVVITHSLASGYHHVSETCLHPLIYMKNKNSIKSLLFFIGNGLEIKAMAVRSNVLLKDTLPCQQTY